MSAEDGEGRARVPHRAQAARWAREAVQAFERVRDALPGMVRREGQQRMAECVAHTLARAPLGGGTAALDARRVSDEAAQPVRSDAPEAPLAAGDAALPEPAAASDGHDAWAEQAAREGWRVAVIQAGTGVGKSLAYSAPALALALARQTRVLISTATVALQEQLVHKDLPALAAVWPEPLKVALAKGRGRYVCRLKLERLLGGAVEEEDLFGPAPLAGAESAAAVPQAAEAAASKALVQRRARWQGWAQALVDGQWDGERDSLPVQPEPEDWLPVAADAASCTSRHCPLFAGCAYFERRKELAGAQVVVVNHDLLLASLGTRTLPELNQCLLLIDEAHHLPEVALAQFTRTADLTRLRWMEALGQRGMQVGAALAYGEAVQGPRLAARLRSTVQELARLLVQSLGAGEPLAQPQVLRLPHGRLPEALRLQWEAVAEASEEWLAHLSALAKRLKAELKERPEEARHLSELYAQLGVLAPRLEALADCARLFLAEPSEGQAPPAKWLQLQAERVFGVAQLHVRACASPIVPAAVLRQHLWPRVGGAVLTSATLTSCGRFDFFLAESGLALEAGVTTLAVPSPFDFARQASLLVCPTRADPRDVPAYTEEMLGQLMRDLARVQSGALVLFTSREQLRAASQRLPPALKPRVLVQGQWSRAALLQRHRAAVQRGEVSIIFGLQSFGEGLDLPGALCAHLFIAKLPFASPDDPVSQARAEWLQAQGRNPFMELVVPAAALRLAQWVGRAIRTETDRAEVVCYDRRLQLTAWGQRMLQGLPPLKRL